MLCWPNKFYNNWNDPPPTRVIRKPQCYSFQKINNFKIQCPISTSSGFIIPLADPILILAFSLSSCAFGSSASSVLFEWTCPRFTNPFVPLISGCCSGHPSGTWSASATEGSLLLSPLVTTDEILVTGFFSLTALKGTVRGTTSLMNSRLSRRETALAVKFVSRWSQSLQ